jgi:RHS repeat-associated protein
MPLDDADKKGQPVPNNTQKLPQEPAALQADNTRDYTKNNLLQIPSIPLPKGGGALRSIDEKFQVNPANGTSSFNITVPLSKPRSDFAPSLSLSYNSGGGNSPFGLGWDISLPSIKRRTDKKLPQYRDAFDSDTFQFTGEEDLVPKMIQDTSGHWTDDIVTISSSYNIRRYRPRIEGAFTLIEKITNGAALYWKTTTKDNIVTFFGLSALGRITDPYDQSKIFKWLPELSYDDKGNCFQYAYVAEDAANVPNLLHEGNRLNGNQLYTNRYLKSIQYGNTTPYLPAKKAGFDPYNPSLPATPGYTFQLVLDYGEHDLANPIPDPTPGMSWTSRLDPFSDCKAGFEIRTYRLCRRFLVFHGFTELPINPMLVRSLDLAYYSNQFKNVPDPYDIKFVEADFIASATETGWKWNPGAGSYDHNSYPPATFNYQLPQWSFNVENIDPGNSPNIPEGLSNKYQFTDLWNEGISGILSEQSEGWYYNSNLGDGVFTPPALVSPKPSFTGLNGGGLQLESLTGDGRKFIVSTQSPNLGYFELTDTQEWQPFMAFDRYPHVNTSDPNIKFIDLNGDGMPDIVLSEEQVFTWWPAAGICGYDSPEMAYKTFDEEKGPAIVFADPVDSIFLADMTGDGLTDIVRIRNGEISYWPNMGYGRFGAKVNMIYAPEFDTIDAFNPAYLHLADINGTGATDIIYLGKNVFRAWLNLSGNAWGPAVEIDAFPDTTTLNQLAVADLLGNGTACIVWSSPLAANADAPLRYIDLMGGKKPYLMNEYSNGLGKAVSLHYKTSTWFYLQDKAAGIPWITKLPFPVQCVAQTTIHDAISGSDYTSGYTYHHGYYDHPEKEFRGFGRVDQTDTDDFDTNAAADQAPVLTRTWFHTGAYFGIGRILNQLAHEYFQNTAFAEYNLPQPELPPNLTADEVREACRACKGMTLRQEIYALDASANPTLAPYPYSVAEHNNKIVLLQPRENNVYASFLVMESEAITYHYERNPADPRIAHTLNTLFDAYGNILNSYAVVYPRLWAIDGKTATIPLPGNQPFPAPVNTEQQKLYINYLQNTYTTAIMPGSSVSAYRLPQLCDSISWQLTGLTPSGTYFSIADFVGASSPALNKLKQQRTIFLKDDLVTPLPLTQMDPMGVIYQNYHLAFDQTQTVLNPNAPALLAGAKYIQSDGSTFPAPDNSGIWWVPSGTIQYLNSNSFYLPYQYTDAYGYATTLAYDNYLLLIQSITDPVGNTTTAATAAVPYDYRVLSPQTVLDPNNNATDFQYDLLGLVAGIAVRGKGEGDALSGFTPDLTATAINNFFTDPYTYGPALLQGATTRFVYQFPTAATPGPFSAGHVTRPVHLHQPAETWTSGLTPVYQFSFEYTDGLGRSAMNKIQADTNTGTATATSCTGTATPRNQWIGKGKTVYNNKGKAVMQFEPYFSPTPAYEEAPANGVSPVSHYDPFDRLIRTDFPDGSYSRTAFDAWMEIVYDQNDTVAEPGNQWFQANSVSPDPHTADAATKAFAHANTPTLNHLDTLGRNFYTVAFNIVTGIDTFYSTYVQLDLNNNPLQVIDARSNTVVQYDYDYLNRITHKVSMEAGERWALNDCMDKPVYQWDANGANQFVHYYRYDPLQRPLTNEVQINAGTPILYAYNVYGENIGGAADITNNLRGQLYRQFDESGLVTQYLYDFKGNLIQSSRIFGSKYKSADGVSPVNNYSGNPAADMGLLETDPVTNLLQEYTTLMHYDALNRPVMQVRPFLSPAAAIGNIIPAPYTQAAINNADVIVPGYGSSGALNTVNVFYRGGTTATNYVARIGHNEKGQRLCIQYGNSTVTRYTYDVDTFRVTELLTTSNAGLTVVQQLSYYYDPIGNITYLADNSKPTAYYDNHLVSPDGDYTYDAIYRLITAKGREQIAQNTVDESSANNNDQDYPFNAVNPLPAPTDPLAMRAYTQNYSYDAVGNMTELKHVAGGGSYTRTFVCNASNNQLTSTQTGGAPAIAYTYDTHGNMTALPQLSGMAWNFKDQFVLSGQQVVSSGGTGQTTFYTYNAGGTRARKVTEGATAAGGTPVRIADRLYMGNFEVYRTYNGATITLQRETLHIMDDKSRIAMIDNKTIDTADADATTLNTYYPRFQLSNHLASAVFELDMNANLISSEEYHPFGTTSYQAGNAALDVPAKRYRYTGKERDEESGLYYHGARYYAPWLCRWTSADPISIKGGLNVYGYANNNPVKEKDSTGNAPDGGPTNTIEDIFTFIRNQAGFESGAKRALSLSSGMASPAGTAHHAQATEVVDAIKQIGVKGAERIYSEVRVVAGKITQIGGTPGGPKGSLNLDLVAVKEGETLAVGGTVSPTNTEAVGDLKYGGGKIKNSHADLGERGVTVNGKTAASTSEEVKALTEVKDVEGAVNKVEAATKSLSKAEKVEETVVAVTKLTSKVAKVAETAAPVIKAVARVAKVAAPALKVVGKVAGPLAIGLDIVNLATAKTQEEQVDAGISLAADSLMASGNPVAEAAGGGLMVGQVLEHNLHVSDYSAGAGMWVREKTMDTLGDTGSLIAGGVTTIVATPAALAVAAWDYVF